MAATVRGTPAVTDTSAGTSHSLSLQSTVSGSPASPLVDSLLLLLVGGGNVATITDQANTFNSNGFTTELYKSEGVPSLSGCYWVVAKKATGSETSITVNTSASTKLTAFCIEVTNWFGTVATGVELARTEFPTSTNSYDPPSLAPSWGADSNLWFTGIMFQSTATNGITGPGAPWTSLQEQVATLTADASLSVYQQASSNASEDPAAFTFGPNNRDGIAFTIAVRPPAAAGGGLFIPSFYSRNAGLFLPKR